MLDVVEQQCNNGDLLPTNICWFLQMKVDTPSQGNLSQWGLLYRKPCW